MFKRLYLQKAILNFLNDIEINNDIVVFFNRTFSVPPDGGTANSIYSISQEIKNNSKCIVVCENQNSFNYNIFIKNEILIIQHPDFFIRPRELFINQFLLKSYIKNIINTINAFQNKKIFISRHLYYSNALNKINQSYIYLLASFYAEETLEFLSRKENSLLKNIYLKFQFFLQTKLESDVIKNTKNIGVLSSKRKNYLFSKYSKNSFLINPGISSSIQKKKYIPQELKSLLIHCRHEVRKNIDGFLNEVHRNLEFYNLLKINIIGKGPETEYLKNLSKELSLNHIVKFHGYVDKLSDFYNNSDFMIFPSIQEGFGQVITESIGFGVPVIAYNNVDTPSNEIIQNNVTGILVEKNSLDEITNILKMYKKNTEKFVKISQKCIMHNDDRSWVNTYKLIKEIL